MRTSIKPISMPILILGASLCMHAWAAPMRYTGEQLNQIAFPIGGLGAGMYCIEGTGALGSLSITHKMDFFNEPNSFAAITILGQNNQPNVTRVLEGPVPLHKYFNRIGAASGYMFKTYGLPRFETCTFTARFPFAEIDLADKDLPLKVKLTAWSPFIPGDVDASSLPAGALEYTLTNTGLEQINTVFSFNTHNFMNGSIGSIEGGFILYGADGADREDKAAFAFFIDDPDVKVNHAWFRGGWWDSITIAWEDVIQGRMRQNPSSLNNETGATLSLPVTLAPGETKTVTLNTCWYVPQSGQRYGQIRHGAVSAFGDAPSSGAGRLQHPVIGFLGKHFVNTYDGTLDEGVGTLTSPPFTVTHKMLYFLCGGGNDQEKLNVQILSNTDEVLGQTTGNNTENLSWQSYDISSLANTQIRIRIVDQSTNSWGHILADQFILSDYPLEDLVTSDKHTLINDYSKYIILQDFEDGYGDWIIQSDAPPPTYGAPQTYTPWYATQFSSINEMAQAWREQAPSLRTRSNAFADAFHSQTLPSVILEAVSANLSILKSPTIMRQHDGKLWGWEGNNDIGGIGMGSNSLAWNYAQAICHLFPAGERTFRETQFYFGQEESGRQALRKNLPITPGGSDFDTPIGALGEIMSVHREWRISGDSKWLIQMWPKIKDAMNYVIATWDPEAMGLLTHPHHSPYASHNYTPDSLCSSFYLGALTATIRMGYAAEDNVDQYRTILARGRHRMETELFNGEYFIQKTLSAPFPMGSAPVIKSGQDANYIDIVDIVNAKGSLYQYGSGCLSNGLLGLGIARACYIDEDIVNPDMIRSHLNAVYSYNFKSDLALTPNIQRIYAIGQEGGLITCSWPRGDKPPLPINQSDEISSGTEYQVALHLISIGEIEKGLEIIRTTRKRYDGRKRNPFNEIEDGHFSARSMASYALIQGLTGLRYDAISKTLYINGNQPNARFFLATNTGFGLVTTDEDGNPTISVIEGAIPTSAILTR